MQDLVKISKFLSMVLRHRPEAANLTMDKEGWVSVDQLLTNVKPVITFDELQHIVDTNNKKRFAFNEDKTKIRASQGHSADVGVELKLDEVVPPFTLFHGTPVKNVDSIKKTGLNKGTRTHVHLSKDEETATLVGQRRGKAVVLKIDAWAMRGDGFKFYLSENGVYLTDHVPPKYIL